MKESLQERRTRRKKHYINSLQRKYGVEEGSRILKLMEGNPIRNCVLECLYVIDFDKKEKIQEL